MKFKVFILATVVSLCSAMANATPIAIDLAGNQATDTWADGSLTAANYSGYGSFPGFGMWPAPIVSTTGDAALSKASNGPGGGPFLAGESIYFGSFASGTNLPGGSLRITDSTPFANVENVVFQIKIGEVNGYDFYDHADPILTVNGVSTLSPVVTQTLVQIYNGMFDPDGAGPLPEEPIYINTVLFQYDLSSFGSVASLQLDWSAVVHAQIYALQLDQSDEFVQLVFAEVPEPSTFAMMGLAIGGLAIIRRRKSK